MIGGYYGYNLCVFIYFIQPCCVWINFGILSRAFPSQPWQHDRNVSLNTTSVSLRRHALKGIQYRVVAHYASRNGLTVYKNYSMEQGYEQGSGISEVLFPLSIQMDENPDSFHMMSVKINHIDAMDPKIVHLYCDQPQVRYFIVPMRHFTFHTK